MLPLWTSWAAWCIACLLQATLACAQEQTDKLFMERDWENTDERMHWMNNRPVIKPSPNQPGQLFELLKTDAVRSELALTEGQVAEEKQFIDRLERERQKAQQEIIRSAESGLGRDGLRRKRDVFHLDQCRELLQFYQSWLTGYQYERLRQIAFRIEIRKVGLFAALAWGSLGIELGIDETQRERISSVGPEMEKEFRSLWRARQQSYESRLVELTLDNVQRSQLRKLQGAPAELHAFSMELRAFRRYSSDPKGFTVQKAQETDALSTVDGLPRGFASWRLSHLFRKPVELDGNRVLAAIDRDDKWALVRLLLNPSVRKELQLTDAELERIGRIVAKFNHNTDLKGRPQAATCDDALTADQWQRLQEIARQFEVIELGLAQALAFGRLGMEVGVRPDQQSLILTENSKLQPDFEADLRSIQKRYEQVFLSAIFEAEQQENITRTIGEPFICEIDSETRRAHYAGIKRIKEKN